jgi:hypothetical protein
LWSESANQEISVVARPVPPPLQGRCLESGRRPQPRAAG